MNPPPKRSGRPARTAGLIAALLLVFAGPAVAAVNPDWTRVDVNGDGQPEYVVQTNQVDIALSNRGEVVGWYLKLVKGEDFKGNYKRTSIVSSPSARVELPGALANAPVTGATARTGRDTTAGGALRLTGRFSYSQGAARVTKTYTINPRLLTVSLITRVEGAGRYGLAFYGLSNRPQLKALESGATAPVGLGAVRAMRYASLQCCNTAFGGTGEAIIVRPVAPAGPPIAARVESSAGSATLTPDQEKLERGVIRLGLPGGRENAVEVYGGPNELIRLRVEGYSELPGLFQPNLLGQLSLALVQVMRFLRELTNSWGLAIILLTVLIKLATWPLLQTQLRSTAEMQALQPRVKEINEKFKDKPEKKQEAMMTLYKEHGVNPAAGCLPLLVQMPVLLVMWKVIANYEFDQGFLWLRDLSLPDPLYILPVLYVGANILQTYFSTVGNRDMFRQQLVIQLVFVYIVLSFPSGTTLYWVLSTLIGVGQQFFINRQIKARMNQGRPGGPGGPKKLAA